MCARAQWDSNNEIITIINNKNMANLFGVKDKVVIITGGAGILGRGIAGHLAEEGAKIVILDRAAEVGEQIVAGIKPCGS